MSRLGTIRNLAAGAMLAGAMAIGGAGLSLAQETTTTVESHPSHIHAGTCAELDPNPAAPLNNLLPIGVDPDDIEGSMAELEPVGVLTASPIFYADNEDVEFSWDDMLAESHAINVHLSDQEIDQYIACGDIGGVIVDDGEKLVVALHPQNDSGYSGIAILEKDDDDNVDVEIYLAGPMTDNAPVATPAA
jgi:hypothetical protein